MVMFYQIFLQSGRFSRRQAFASADRAVTWGELTALAERCREQTSSLAGRRVAMRMEPTAVCIAGLAALDRLGCDVFLLDSQLDPNACDQLAGEMKLGAVVEPAKNDPIESLRLRRCPGEETGSGASSVTILTSGTTGKPKAARHTWETLARPVRRTDPSTAQRWLLTYRPHLYAGLQVLLQCLVNYGTLIAPRPTDSPEEVARLMLAYGAEYASATPSYWRRLILFAEPDTLRNIKLVQITLGGEVVDQQILDALGKLFPKARIAHVYATTELGRCFSVTDGKAGFPAKYLEAPSPDGVETKLVDGEIHVRSANAMRRYDPFSPAAPRLSPFSKEEWLPTGDLAEIHDDRVFFVGRRTDMINVGGNKVHPIEVERVVRSVPGVADVRVYGKRSSIVGQLVACEIVAAAGEDHERVRRAVTALAESSLRPFQRPHIVEMVERIELSDSGKVGRGATT